MRPIAIRWTAYFNPRSPRGGATFRYLMFACYLPISIHAPHEGERPPAGITRKRITADFNPRSPRGGATFLLRVRANGCLYFNPRSPRGGATFDFAVIARAEDEISIHAPHEGERHAGRRAANRHRRNFNPRSPRGGATFPRLTRCLLFNAFQSTLPTRGSDGGKVHLYAAFPRIY